MKSVRFYGIHDIRFEEIDKPVVKNDEVLIKVHYAGICGSDLHIYNKGMFVENIPETMGHEFVGEIVETGPDAKSFKPNDLVVANPMVTCGTCPSCLSESPNTCENLGFIGEVRQGCFAEYIALPEKWLCRVPAGSDLKQMALAEPLAVAINLCERAELKPEDTLGIIGAGPIGLLVFLVATKLYGVRDITMVNRSEARLKLAQKLGANKTTSSLEAESFGKTVDVAGSEATLNMAIEHTRAGGAVYVASIFEDDFIFDVNSIVSKQLNLVGCNAYLTRHIDEAIKCIAEGKIDVRDIISREFALEECAAAFEAFNNKAVCKVLFKTQK